MLSRLQIRVRWSFHAACATPGQRPTHKLVAGEALPLLMDFYLILVSSFDDFHSYEFLYSTDSAESLPFRLSPNRQSRIHRAQFLLVKLDRTNKIKRERLLYSLPFGRILKQGTRGRRGFNLFHVLEIFRRRDLSIR